MQRHHLSPGIPLISALFWLAACNGGSSPPALSLPPPATTSPPAVTPSPTTAPVTEARMDGTYLVVKKVTKRRNFAGIRVGDVLRRTYRIKPTCPIGPCGAFIKINLAETNQNITRKLAYHADTNTYSLVPVVTPVICTGTNGVRYRLKTTDTVDITPVASQPTLVDVVVTKWTGKEVVKAVPEGAARAKGHCKPALVNYDYVGTLQ